MEKTSGQEKKKVICPLCKVHKDSQALGFECPIIKSEMTIKGTYQEIFREEISQETIRSLEMITKFRQETIKP